MTSIALDDRLLASPPPDIFFGKWQKLMTITFSNAPLVEIIVELRWGQNPQLISPNQAIVSSINAKEVEEFFMHFGGEIYQQGFERAERLLPPGFPALLFQPVYRYRKSSDPDSSVLYQAGPGLFSANAIPPYRSWETFSPVVQAGVEALLKTRSASEKNLPFTSLKLRYIDAFGPTLTEGRDIGGFIKDILGITVELPEALSKHIMEGKPVVPTLQFAIPLANSMTMNIIIADGVVNNEKAIVMDTSVVTTEDVQHDRDAIMGVLNTARVIIHEMFFDITTRINGLMQPSGGE